MEHSAKFSVDFSIVRKWRGPEDEDPHLSNAETTNDQDFR
jgi:hypothetical protein